MPSVGMRRSTRVFVPKSVAKHADGARVLRSGRRLWSESVVGKPGRGSDGDEWLRLLDHAGDADDLHSCKDNERREVVPENEVAVMELDGKTALAGSLNNAPGVSMAGESVDRYGTVYHRKRQRLDMNRSFSSSFPSEGSVSEDRMYGIHFVRKQRRKMPSGPSLTVTSEGLEVSEDNTEVGFLRQDVSLSGFSCKAMSAVVIRSSCSSSSRFACFLNSILCYMMRTRVRLSELAAFICCKPIAPVFSRNGIHFGHDLSCNNTQGNGVSAPGICKIFGAWRFIPLFSLNFSSVPLSFMYLHVSILLRSSYLPDVLVRCSDIKVLKFSDSQKRLSCIPTEVDLSGGKFSTSGNTSINRRQEDRDPKSAAHGAFSRSAVNSSDVQKSSLRSARATNILVDLHKSFRVKSADLPSVSDHHPSLSCSANILVIEPLRCYREEGAKVTLECVGSNEWYIAVKIQGSLRYRHKAQNAMGPSTSANRFTRAMIWTEGNGWKLEFSDRQELFNFKELYRECYDRNAQGACVRIIPVPGVSEVPGYGNSKCIPFVRPETYITMYEDEVTRALMKTTANYDIQSDDEELINKLNNEVYDGENGGVEHISADNFEKIIDVFEKAAYRSPDDVSDVNKATSLCLNLGRKDIVAAIYDYWHKKWKQKHSTLVKVFQCHPPRRAPVVHIPFLQKKRSFKQRRSRYGRGKQPIFFQAMAADHAAALRRVEEAEGSVRKSQEVAIFKRQRVQIFMENADLAIYKATIALRIAESAQRAESQAAAASTFLG